MQTFMPYSDFELVAKCLDNKRLNKQITEAKQILDIIEGRTTNSWANHTAVRMWIGYENALRLYVNTMINEWRSRGYNSHSSVAELYPVIMPPWISNSLVLISHRNSLLNKFPEHYSKFGWSLLENAPTRCYWPTEPKSEEVKKTNKQWEELFYDK